MGHLNIVWGFFTCGPSLPVGQFKKGSIPILQSNLNERFRIFVALKFNEYIYKSHTLQSTLFIDKFVAKFKPSLRNSQAVLTSELNEASGKNNKLIYEKYLHYFLPFYCFCQWLLIRLRQEPKGTAMVHSTSTKSDQNQRNSLDIIANPYPLLPFPISQVHSPTT